MNAVNMPGFAAEVSIYKQVERIPARNNSCLQSNEKQEVISQICIGNEEKDLRYFIAYGLFMTTRTAVRLDWLTQCLSQNCRSKIDFD